MMSRGVVLAIGVAWSIFALLNLFVITADPLSSAAPMIIGAIAGMNFGAAALLPPKRKGGPDAR